MSPVAPLMSVVLFTKIVVLYKGLSGPTAALVCFIVIGTVVPQAACNVALTAPAPEAALSFRKSSVIVEVSKPFVNFLLESPIAVTSSSSKTRLIVALVTFGESTTELRVVTTPFDRNTAIAYSSLFSVVGVFVFVSFFGASVI
jgi:hypothetical protein